MHKKDWQPFSYQKRLDVKHVAKKKQKLSLNTSQTFFERWEVGRNLYLHLENMLMQEKQNFASEKQRLQGNVFQTPTSSYANSRY